MFATSAPKAATERGSPFALLFRVRFAITVLTLPGIFTIVISAREPGIDFASLIKTPAGIQTTLERCDGSPQFETAFANWLETAQPRSPAQREAIRNSSLRLLEDTSDRQLALGLINGLLRHAAADVDRDPAIAPTELARALYAAIGRASRNRKARSHEIALLAHELSEDGTVTNNRQASFVQELEKLAEPFALRHLHRAEPIPASHTRPPGVAARKTAVTTELTLAQP